MKTVHIARGLTLPAAELATEVIASLGQRGGGKSNGAAVIAEGLLAANVPVIVLDYVGIWFSLRLQPDGKHSSDFQIPVLGGRHGDITLVPTTGSLVAEALARTQSSAVLDISMFSKSDRCRFATDFAEAFFRAKKDHPGPVQLLLEEAQRFVPQKLFTGQERMLGAFEEIAEVGRNYGIGLHLISQRPQKINKDVLNLADTVFAYRTNGVLERKALAEWVQEKDADGRDAVKDELPGLDRGQAIVWSPPRKIYGRYTVGLKTTYDAGATPVHARAAVKTKPLDLKSLEAVMGAAVEEAKANDPRALKARIAELERGQRNAGIVVESLAQRAREKPPRVVEKFVLRPSDLQKFERAARTLADRGDALSSQYKQAAQASAALQTLLDQLLGVVRAALQPTQLASPERGPRQTPPPPTPLAAGRASSDGEHEHLPEKVQRMIGALMQGEAMGRNTMPFRTVAILAGVSPNSGTTRNRKAQLTGGGYAIVAGDHVALTAKGRAYPVNVAMPPTGPGELLDFWKREIGTTKIAAMLEEVVLRGPSADVDLAQAAGMEQSGTFRNYKAALTGRGLIEKRGDVYVAAEAFQR